MTDSTEANEPDDEIEPEYDFRTLRGAVRGKYAARYQERLRVIRLEPDISEAFSDETAVNAALREYLNWRQDHPAGKLP